MPNSSSNINQNFQNSISTTVGRNAEKIVSDLYSITQTNRCYKCSRKAENDSGEIHRL